MSEMNLNQLAAYFAHTAELLGHYDPQPILEKLRDKLVVSTQANFSGRHTPDGLPWKPIVDSTRPPLQRKGNLLQAAIEAAWHSVQPDTLAIDTSLLPDYWRFQQDGTARIPSRAFIGLSESLIGAGEQMLVDDVQDRLLAS